MIIPFKEAKKQKLIRITEWQYQTEIISTLSDEYEVIAICPNCSTPLKTKKKLNVPAIEWMQIFSNKMNEQNSERNFVIVEHGKKNHVYAVFAKPCEDK